MLFSEMQAALDAFIPADVANKEGAATTEQLAQALCAALNVITAIQEVFDGTEWGPDTNDAAARKLTAIGLRLREPYEDEEASA